MALDTATYLVTRTIAIRSGLIESRYRIADGRFVLDNKDLQRVRLTSEEYITGLQGVEKVSEEEARTLIARNGYKMGDGAPVSNTQSVQQEVPEESADEETLEANEETLEETLEAPEESEETEEEQNTEE